MKKYLYKICSLCKEHKPENRSPYCRKCSREYGKCYRLLKKSTPQINKKGLGQFINKIESNGLFIELEDINTIIFFYEIITDNINEYDQYKFGKQIRLMWERIVDFHRKDIYKRKK